MQQSRRDASCQVDATARTFLEISLFCPCDPQKTPNMKSPFDNKPLNLPAKWLIILNFKDRRFVFNHDTISILVDPDRTRAGTVFSLTYLENMLNYGKKRQIGYLGLEPRVVIFLLLLRRWQKQERGLKIYFFDWLLSPKEIQCFVRNVTTIQSNRFQEDER